MTKMDQNIQIFQKRSKMWSLLRVKGAISKTRSEIMYRSMKRWEADVMKKYLRYDHFYNKWTNRFHVVLIVKHENSSAFLSLRLRNSFYLLSCDANNVHAHANYFV